MDTTFFFLMFLGMAALVAIAATARLVMTDGYHKIATRGPDEGFDPRL
jgi:hypothetical protein